MKQKQTAMQAEIATTTILNLSITDKRVDRKSVRMYKNLENTINQLDLTNIYRILNPTTVLRRKNSLLPSWVLWLT